MERHPWIPYVVPFVGFMLFLGLEAQLDLPPRTNALARAVAAALLILLVARPVLRFDVERPWGTVGMGILVFLIWIAPDQLIPGYRSSALFQNSIVGQVDSSVPTEARRDAVVLGFRLFRGVIVVPIVEELFWRGWFPRWVEKMDDFRSVPLGQFSRVAFWSSAALFAVEHGSYWDVGLAAGVAYNWWMVKTKSLGDLILCHSVTNACLAGWVLITGQWQFW